VWDYPGGGMGFMDAFWEAANATDPASGTLDEGARFPFCTPDTLADEFTRAGLRDAEVRPIEVTTRFTTFDDFWRPFTLGAGPAPGYYASLDPDHQDKLR